MLLEVSGLYKRFGGLRAVNRVSFHVEQSETVGIIGPNGAGKTTTFNLISGLLRPDAGRTYFAGTDITGWAPHRRARSGIARTFQIVQPFETLSVLENVMVSGLFASRGGRAVTEIRQHATELCDLVGLHEKGELSPGDLTVVGLKRLELARALASAPRLLMLDEFMEGLTPAEAEEAIALIQRLKEDLGLTVLLIDHVMHTVGKLCDRVVVMHHGEILTQGSYRQVVEHPDVIEAYLGRRGDTHAGA